VTNLKGYTLKFVVTAGAISSSFPSVDVVKFFQTENGVIIAYELTDPKQYDTSRISFLDKTSNKRIVLHVNDIVFVFASPDTAQNRYVGEPTTQAERFMDSDSTKKRKAIMAALDVLADERGFEHNKEMARAMFDPHGMTDPSKAYMKKLASGILSIAFEELYEETGLA